MDPHSNSSDPMQKVLDRLDGFGTEFSTFSSQVKADVKQLNGSIHSLW